MITRACRLGWWSALYLLGLLPWRYRRGGWLPAFNAFWCRKGVGDYGNTAFRTVEDFEFHRQALAQVFHERKNRWPVLTNPELAQKPWQAPEASCHLFSFVARREQHPLRFLHWMRWLPWRGLLLEFGSGAAPLAWGLGHAWPLHVPTVVCADIRWVLRDYCQHQKLGHVIDVQGAGMLAPYDGIVCTETLEHVPDPLATAKQLMAWLRPGGILIADYAPQEWDQPMAPQGSTARGATRHYLSTCAGRVLQREPFFVIEKT